MRANVSSSVPRRSNAIANRGCPAPKAAAWSPIRLAKPTRFLQNSAHMKTTILPSTHSLNRSPLRAFLLVSFALACFALAPAARATCQDACLSNNNTVQGDDALISLTTAFGNTAIGFQALLNNTSGSFNTATGNSALLNNTSGSFNTAVGHALGFNTTGNFNTAVGDVALAENTTGISNTAIGTSALFSLTTGNMNTAIGVEALSSARGGSSNIAVGFGAGENIKGGSYNIDIGNSGTRTDADTIRIGTATIQTATYIAGISGATVPTGVAVIVDSTGHLGTTTSSERFKEAVKPMDKASEAILALKPVTFRYKKELDPAGIQQFGLVAEQVEKVNPDLVARDADGKPYTVCYEAVNAMLLNEFLKEHGKVEKLEATVAQQQKALQAAIAALKQTVTAQLNRQAAEIQKLTTRLETSKPVLQTIANNQ
jgi:hypothetical protein